MKTLNESDLLKIVKRVLNEQKDKEFDEDEIDLLHFIFERELKPPFREGEKNSANDYSYYNRDGEEIGELISISNYGIFAIKTDPFLIAIEHKVCSAYELNTFDWSDTIKPHLKSWMENQINIELIGIY